MKYRLAREIDEECTELGVYEYLCSDDTFTTNVEASKLYVSRGLKEAHLMVQQANSRLNTKMFIQVFEEVA